MSSPRRLRTAEPPLSPIAVPQMLRDIPRWICWDYMDYGDGKKPRKVPISPNGDYGINYNDPSAWRSFDDVMQESGRRGGLGVGFVFSEEDNIVGVDLDNAYDEQAWLKPWAREIAKVFAGAFCEQTPSGLGLHFIGLSGKINGRTRVEVQGGDGGIERYSENRWFTFTGIPVCEGEVVDIRQGMSWLEDNYFGGPVQQRAEATTFPVDVDLDIELARVCLEHIGRNRVSIGDDWRAVGYACKGTSESLMEDWIRWSAQWPEFSREECLDRWSRFDSRSGVGTLVYMAASDSGVSSKFLRDESQRRLGRLPDKASEADSPTPTLLDAIEAWRQQEATPALPTGIPSLDKLFDGGLPLGQMTALAAAPGVGKSALALHLVVECLIKNENLVASWCLGEMTRAALAARAITNFDGKGCGLTLQDVIHKKPPADEIATTMGKLIGSRLKIIEAPLMIDRIEQAVAKDKPQLIVVDYIQLVQSSRHFQDSTGEIVDCLRKLRQITTAHNMATIIVTNVAKGVDHTTEIGNIGKGSNQIDFDVDNFLFGHRAGETGADGELRIEWLCKKLRQGQMSDVSLWFHGKYQRFIDESEPTVGPIEDFAQFAPQPASGTDWSAF
jgi:hypothetical protein